jgi:hypothetical protein|tara:strand:- start:567 stop:884 length:318 start_codon:yes stop_codon:yes gene_type:complete
MTTDTKSTATQLVGVTTDFIAQSGDLIAKHTQNISQAFLDDLKDAKHDSAKAPIGDMMRVASIPTAVIEQWTREGFNIYEESGKAIIKRLREQSLDAFITTEKRI